MAGVVYMFDGKNAALALVDEGSEGGDTGCGWYVDDDASVAARASPKLMVMFGVIGKAPVLGNAKTGGGRRADGGGLGGNGGVVAQRVFLDLVGADACRLARVFTISSRLANRVSSFS